MHQLPRPQDPLRLAATEDSTQKRENNALRCLLLLQAGYRRAPQVSVSSRNPRSSDCNRREVDQLQPLRVQRGEGAAIPNRRAPNDRQDGTRECSATLFGAMP